MFNTSKVPELSDSKNTFLINTGIIQVNTGIFKLNDVKAKI